MKKAEDFFSIEDKEKIIEAIKSAEKDTSGEIRVHLENNLKGDVLDRAAFLFEKLQMHTTKDRNGVLFYLAINDRKFAILGDAGINAVAPGNFWDEIKEKAISFFKEEKFTEGLVTGISMAGNALKVHFPYKSDDVNELTDEISFGKN
jgi:uncharacterized membrane protein